MRMKILTLLLLALPAWSSRSFVVRYLDRLTWTTWQRLGGIQSRAMCSLQCQTRSWCNAFAILEDDCAMSGMSGLYLHEENGDGLLEVFIDRNDYERSTLLNAKHVVGDLISIVMWVLCSDVEKKHEISWPDKKLPGAVFRVDILKYGVS